MRVRGAVLVLLVCTACATPVGVQRVPPERVHEDLTANVLSSDRPSADSLQVLTIFGLRQLWEDDPEAALRALHEGLPDEGGEARVFALSELSFAHAERGGGRPWFVASAVFAWAFLFPGDAGTPPDIADRRARLAFDLYNRGLIEGLPQGEIEKIPAEGSMPFPFGTLRFESEGDAFVWAGHRLHHFIPSADFEVHGLANRYRGSGIGAPLTAQMETLREGERIAPADRWVRESTRVPLTVVLVLEDARRHLRSGDLRGRLEVFYFADERFVEIEGRAIPLEIEWSSALADALADPSLWQFELRGFFSGSYKLSAGETPDRLVMLHPWIPGRVPVVLVHGTASSPGRWADLVNELANDPLLSDRVQVWLFMYNTGNPITYSAGLLRRALGDAVSALDPEGRDPALRQAVVIGHSQGGLLTRLQVTDPGLALWDSIFERPPEEVPLKPDDRAVLEQSLLFEPSPMVGRVVYVSTPHHGSYLASFRLANLLSSMLRLPASLVGLGVDLATLDTEGLLVRRIERLPTSIDNMTPGNHLIRELQALPPVDWVPGHSIIPVKGGPPPEGQNDGVVAYDSAHLEGVVSEKVVYHASHSVQGHPEAILEVKRILREHLGELEARGAIARPDRDARRAADRESPPATPMRGEPATPMPGEAATPMPDEAATPMPDEAATPMPDEATGGAEPAEGAP